MIRYSSQYGTTNHNLQIILTFLIHKGILDVFLSDYDIICLSETFTDDPDLSDTPRYLRYFSI